MHCIILYNILYKINDFLIGKSKVLLFLAKLIGKENSSYIDALNMKNLVNINEKMLDKSEATEIPKIKLITLKSKYITFIRLRSRI